MLSGDLVATPGAFDTRPTGHYELWRLAPRAAVAACWLHAVGLVFDDSGGHSAGSGGSRRSQRLGTVIVATADASGQALGQSLRLGGSGIALDAVPVAFSGFKGQNSAPLWS